MRGPRLLPVCDDPSPSVISTSFLASKHPEHTKRAIFPNGWKCLTGSSSST
jgi:hypothetical protein